MNFRNLFNLLLLYALVFFYIKPAFSNSKVPNRNILVIQLNNNNNTPDESQQEGGGEVDNTSPPSSASSPPDAPETSPPAPDVSQGSSTAVPVALGGSSIITGAGTRAFTVTSLSADELSMFATQSPTEKSASSSFADSGESSQSNDSSSQESKEQEAPIEFYKVVATSEESAYIRAKELAEENLRKELVSKTKEELVEMVNNYTKDINRWKEECAEMSEKVQRLIRPSLSNKYPLALRIDLRENNYKYSYSRRGKSEIYTAKYAFLFKLVRQHKTIIWHAQSKELYAEKVEIVHEQNAKIFHVNGELSEIDFVPEPDVFVIYLVEVNVNVKKSTNAIIYKYNKVKNREKFICRSGFLMDTIWRNDKVVWPPKVDVEEGKDAPEPVYSHKVVIEKVNDGKPSMRVFFHESEEPQDDDDDEIDPDYIIVPDPDNPEPENFKPTTPFPIPQELTPESLQVETQPALPLKTADGKPGLKPEECPKELKVFGVDPADSEKSIQLDQFSLAVSTPSKDIYNYDLSVEAKCNSVTIDDKSVWKYDSGVHGAKHPVKLSYRYSRKVFVFLPVPFVYVKQDNGDWLCSQLNIGFFSLDTANPPNAVEITSSQYELRDNEANNEEFIFEFKGDAKCSEIRFRGNPVWRHDADRFKDSFPKIVGFLKDKTIAIVIGELRILVNLAAANLSSQSQQATPPAGGAQAGEPAKDEKTQKEEGSDASAKPSESGTDSSADAKEKTSDQSKPDESVKETKTDESDKESKTDESDKESKSDDSDKETKSDEAAKDSKTDETSKESMAEDAPKSGPKTFTVELDSDEEEDKGDGSVDKDKSSDSDEKKQGEEDKKAPEAAGEHDSSKKPSDEAKPVSEPDDKAALTKPDEADKPTLQTTDFTVADAKASATTSEQKAPGSPDASSSDSDLDVVETKPSDKPSQETASRTTTPKVEIIFAQAPSSARSDVSQSQGGSATTPAQTPATSVQKSPEEQQHTPSTQPSSGTPVVTQPQTQLTPSLAVRSPDSAPEDELSVVDTSSAGTAAAVPPAQATAVQDPAAQAPAAPQPAHPVPQAQQPAQQTSAAQSPVLVPPLQPSYQTPGAQTGTAAGTAPAAQAAAQVAAPAQQPSAQAGAQPAGTSAQQQQPPAQVAPPAASTPAQQQQQVAQQQQAAQAYVIVPFMTSNGTLAYGYMTIAQYQAAMAAYQSAYAAQAGTQPAHQAHVATATQPQTAQAPAQQTHVAAGTPQQTAQAAVQQAQVAAAAPQQSAQPVTQQAPVAAASQLTTAQPVTKRPQVATPVTQQTAKPATQQALLPVAAPQQAVKPAAQQAPMPVAAPKQSVKPATPQAQLPVAAPQRSVKPAAQQTQLPVAAPLQAAKPATQQAQPVASKKPKKVQPAAQPAGAQQAAQSQYTPEQLAQYQAYQQQQYQAYQQQQYQAYLLQQQLYQQQLQQQNQQQQFPGYQHQQFPGYQQQAPGFQQQPTAAYGAGQQYPGAPPGGQAVSYQAPVHQQGAQAAPQPAHSSQRRSRSRSGQQPQQPGQAQLRHGYTN